MDKLVLDVGCGGNKSYRFKPFFGANIFADIEKPKIQICNFILADVCYLPFKDNTFKTVYCSHVLEHLTNSLQAIKELIRTSKKTVIIKVPHRYSKNAKADSNHVSFFNVKWFRKVLEHIGMFYEIETSWEKRPCLLPLLSMPNEITVTICKRRQFSTL